MFLCKVQISSLNKVADFMSIPSASPKIYGRHGTLKLIESLVLI